ncbi:SIMPL domain-containing protein [Gallaecimonas kandeliae]|uniref:SIMPL domain-containing protein n=1 Tax=Gallaecimonas kandeliae TaxID=3029055 RepID=UPI002647D856|nr:SIMPL domain-containing protein [Gallaecimonas kandeliae]WKE66219.1 SIMPL domain-containing protein [Gallaecimonas kandeliae]
MKSLVTLLVLAIPCLGWAEGSLPDGPHIVVRGEASVTAKPDIAEVRLEVKSIKPDALAAKKEVDKEVNALLKGVSDYGVGDHGVMASNLLTEPNVFDSDGKDVKDGYVATRTLTVTLNGISHLNDFINFALGVGINEVKDITLQSSKADEMQHKATLLAVKDAKDQGQSLAAAFGADLGKVYSINSSSSSRHYGFQGYGYRSGGIERIEVTGSRIDPDDLAPGRYLQATVTFTATVDAVFTLTVK